jgi:(aminoalkyl)phosphonate N-acetyltransferase
MEVLIRSANAADGEELYRMLCDLEHEELDKSLFLNVYAANLQNDYIRYFVASCHERTVGMASCHVQLLLHHTAPVGEIQEMYVDPYVRSQGIGKALLEAVFQFAGSRGAFQVEVASNKARRDTHRFYEREGFLKTHDKLVRKGGPNA